MRVLRDAFLPFGAQCRLSPSRSIVAYASPNRLRELLCLVVQLVNCWGQCTADCLQGVKYIRILLSLSPSALFPLFRVGFLQVLHIRQMALEQFQGTEAISSVEPICRLVFIGPASAGRCKVGLLVF